jgi:hypothetical protein
VLPPDVDYRVMLTFLEFYNTLLQFVLFKLYHQLGLKYPPLLDRRLEEAAAGLAAIMKDLAGVGAPGSGSGPPPPREWGQGREGVEGGGEGGRGRWRSRGSSAARPLPPLRAIQAHARNS